MDYKQNDVVVYDDGVTRGTGKIVGIAGNGQPVVGRTFIIEHLDGKPGIPNDTYPFTHRALMEVHIKGLKC
jgi:hypothetical protein